MPSTKSRGPRFGDPPPRCSSNARLKPRRILDEFNRNRLRNQLLLERLGEEALKGRAATNAIVERELIDVHPDKRVGVLAVESASELLGVFDGGLAVVEGVRN